MRVTGEAPLVPLVSAASALAPLDERPAHWLRRLFAWRSEPKVEWHGANAASRTDPAIASTALELGLSCVAVAAGTRFSPAADVWLDERLCTRLHVATVQSPTWTTSRQVRIPAVVYYLATTFDDGSGVLTWSTQPRAAPTGDLDCRAGKGNLRATFADHQLAVARWARTRSARALRIESAADLAGVLRHYTRHLVPLEELARTLAVLMVFIAVLSVIGWALLTAR